MYDEVNLAPFLMQRYVLMIINLSAVKLGDAIVLPWIMSKSSSVYALLYTLSDSQKSMHKQNFILYKTLKKTVHCSVIAVTKTFFTYCHRIAQSTRAIAEKYFAHSGAVVVA